MTNKPEQPGPTGEPSASSGRDDATRVMYRLRLKPGRERSLRLRHPWVFTGAVDEVEELPGASPGDLGDVVDHRGAFLGRGTVQPESQILCRILSFQPSAIDEAFFEERIRNAAALRRSLFEEGATNSWRAVNSEGDAIPGLVVDRYGDFLAAQTLTSGMLHLRPLWLPVLGRVFEPRGIIERGERARREQVEETPAASRVLAGEAPPPWLEIREEGLPFLIDLESGQKTGFYLDQRANRSSVRRHAADRDVLNLFGYSGAFSVCAGVGGARHVVQVETSAPARELTRRNWERNGLDPARLELAAEDVFRFVRHDTRQYDLLVLDPPPFAKDRSSLDRATRAYKDLHLWSFCRARAGALIWSYSCSQQVTLDLFQKIVFGASLDCGAEVQMLGRLTAGPDHPIHLDHPQGEYLKGLWLRVLRPGTPGLPPRRPSGPRTEG